jgi:hypothetical protein
LVGWLMGGWVSTSFSLSLSLPPPFPRLKHTLSLHANPNTHTQNHQGTYVPVNDLRAILLAPVSKFEKDFPGYGQYLAQQLLNADCPHTRGKGIQEVMRRGVKKLESDYGNCLRAVVNKN